MVSRSAPRTVGLVEVQQVAGRRAERPDGSGDEDVPAGDVARLAGQLCAAAGEAAGLVAETEWREPGPVRPEGRRRDDVRARGEVLPVDRADELGPGRDEFVEHGPLRDAAGEQERAHGAVGQQRAGREAFVESGARVHLARSLAEGGRQPSAAMVPRRRPSVRVPSVARRTCGGRGRPL